jgi:hypothetical protein
MTNIQPEMRSQGLVKLSTMSHGSTFEYAEIGMSKPFQKRVVGGRSEEGRTSIL